MNKLIKMSGAVAGLAVAGLVVWMLAAPTEVQPVSWTPPPAQAAGPLKRIAPARLGDGPALRGPEAVIPDGHGQMLTGLEDGRIVRISSAAAPRLETIANTGGRPLGMALHPDGRLIVADGKRGLVAVDMASKLVSVLTASAGGKPVRFADNVAVSADGSYAYFSDVSEKWGYGQDTEAVVEHGGDGRLLRYEFSTGATTVLLRGLQFANGVAMGPEQAYVLVNETGLYRVHRYWLTGPRAGTDDIFAGNLPGMPDNVSFNGKDRFWVAIYTPRNPLLDGLAGHPYVRKMIARAMQILPRPIEHRSMAIALDLQGRPLASLEIDGAGQYVPITDVHEEGEWLVFGSLTQQGIARLPLAEALAPAAK